jgi:hypothetical protein
MYIIYINTNMEEEMKVRTNNNGMKQLKKLGFKKVPGTEPGFHMYELTPATLQAFDSHFKPQAASNKRQALDKSR